MAHKKLSCNYSIEDIAQSIVRDHPVTKKYTIEDKKKLYAERLALLEDFPDLKKIISIEHLRRYPLQMTKRIVKIGFLPPEIIIVDSRIQDMCYLPFWTFYGSGEGSFNKCAGVGNFSCCPPFNLKADKVQSLLETTDIFLVVQTRASAQMGGGDPGAQFRMLHKLTAEINAALGKKAVVQKFAGGPCFACYPEMCLGEGKCRAPELKIPSLEGMGVCVDQLCKDLALLTGDESWKITWIKGFGADTQTPKSFKATLGLAIALNKGIHED